MFLLPSQTVVAIVQLIVTALQLSLMIFTWFIPRRARPFVTQRMLLQALLREASLIPRSGLSGAEPAIAYQHGLETLPIDVESSGPQLPPLSRPYPMPSPVCPGPPSSSPGSPSHRQTS
jgi:hypothetical protein